MPIHPNADIHPNSIIDAGAIIGAGCKIGPFCSLGSKVELLDNVELFSHVAISGKTRIGSGTKIWPFASIGHQPQDLKYNGERSELIIGENNLIRESVSINPGTEGGGGTTKIGNNCLFMLGSHVGHDCLLGDGIVLANHSALGGHVTVSDHVIVGGLSGVHQFVRIGEGAIIGALSMINSDVIPFGAVYGSRPNLAGLNLIGLKRRGLSKNDILQLRSAFKDLFSKEKTLRIRSEEILNKNKNSYVETMVSFVLADSERSFLVPC